MYKLPENFDASFLVGCNLEMICFNINQVSFHFSGHVVITVGAGLLHQLSDSDNFSSIISPPISESNLMQLLEHSISRALGDKDGTLTMVFDNGHILKCIDTSPNYESYQIKHGDREIIV